MKANDLEERTEKFAADCRAWIKALPRNFTNSEDVRQLTRSSGSVAANYIEANEALSKKDLLMRIRIARKEAKESGLWIRLIDTGTDTALRNEATRLNDETKQLRSILTAILKNSGAA